MTDLWCVHPQTNCFLVRPTSSIFMDKPTISRNITINNIWINAFEELRVYRKQSLFNSCSSSYYSTTTYHPRSSPLLVVRAMAAKKNHSPTPEPGGGNSSHSNSGNSDHSKSGGDYLKGNTPPGSNKSGDTSRNKSQHKPLNWREFRASLYIKEQAENEYSIHNQDRTSAISKSLPLKWAHPISAPENGCLLVATDKLDGVRTFERTVVLLLKSGARNPQEGPFGIVINRPLHKKMKDMKHTNGQLATTFADCSLHFGGPLDANMFLLRAGETNKNLGFEEVIPGMYFGSRNSLSGASGLVKKGILRPQDFSFFMGYAGWQIDQLLEEIESDYWYVAACSSNLIFEGLQNSCSDDLWEEILQLMGGHYSELSRKPKQDI